MKTQIILNECLIYNVTAYFIPNQNPTYYSPNSINEKLSNIILTLAQLFAYGHQNRFRMNRNYARWGGGGGGSILPN